MVIYLEVQAVGVDHIVVDHLDVKARVKVLHQLPQLGTSNTVGAVNSQIALNLDTAHDLLERLRKLLIVALLRGLAIFILCSKGVLAAHDVVELRSGHVLEIDEFDLGCSERSIKDAHQTRSRSTSVASEYYPSRVGHLDINLLHELVVDISNAL